MRVVIAVPIVSAAALTIALSPALAGSGWMWLVAGLAQGLLATIAVLRMRADGSLAERLTPRGGDFTVGVLAAVALLVGSWFLRAELVPPGSAATGWIAQIYVALGDPNTIQRSALLTVAVLAVAGLEELSWRGLLQTELETLLGPRWGWLATAGLFTLASAPSVVLLADTTAGPTPLAAVAAGACGLTWGFLTRAMNRLWPAMFSHMVFLYFTAVQFRVPGITPTHF
jgi:membrane protease YdiL (CAAX protease family)